MTKVVFTHFDVSNWGKVTRAPLVSKTEVCFEKLKNQLKKVSTPLSRVLTRIILDHSVYYGTKFSVRHAGVKYAYPGYE